MKIGYGKISIGYGWIRGMNSATRGHNAIKAGWDSKIRNAGHIGCGR